MGMDITHRVAGGVEPKASTIGPQIVVVPRSERRGLLGRFSVIPEITNPREYGNGTKWATIVIVSFAAITSSTGSPIFFRALAEVAHDLDTTPTVANLSVALYLLAMAFTPIWWSALSEKHGRRTTYLLSFSLFFVFSCISAVSANVAMLIVFRVPSDGAAASVLTIWFLVIFGGVMLMLIFLCLPETIAKRERRSRTEEQKNTSIFVKIFMAIFGPFEALALLRFQPVIVVIWSGVIAFFTMYIMNVSIQAVFNKAPYNFSIMEVGLVYLAPTIGYTISSIFGGRWIDHIMVREATKANRYDENGKLKYFPEDRMRENIWLASTLYPASLIWYGCVQTALTEFTPKKASSGVAVANFVRNILACTGAVVTQPMLDGIGNG
ncbi:Major facilitator superfamily domain general substrate transporter [Penicillium fimorum]|uniref:Major facilitator superfamily domain general substrate transporter n=1 Tax=Penicillium fimorum TaxID=1882269 RepID=A0A9W9XQA0_9EURO|nr:Major facilitator superfamily domain general substrate transporter [Penicillium fimorum]